MIEKYYEKDRLHDYLITEYTSIKNEINRIKTSQITLLTATTSATALILTLVYQFGGIKEMDLLPFLIILPSMIMFFDKAIVFSKLTGYCLVLELILLDKAKPKVVHYFGYDNYLQGQWDLDEEQNLIKEKVKDKNIGEKIKIKPIKKFPYYRLLLQNKVIFWIGRLLSILLIDKKIRFLMTGFYSYLSLILICCIFPYIDDLEHINDILINNIPVLLFWIITGTLISLLIYGKIYELDISSWKFLTLIPGFLSIIILGLTYILNIPIYYYYFITYITFFIAILLVPQNMWQKNEINSIIFLQFIYSVYMVFNWFQMSYILSNIPNCAPYTFLISILPTIVLIWSLGVIWSYKYYGKYSIYENKGIWEDKIYGKQEWYERDLIKGNMQKARIPKEKIIEK